MADQTVIILTRQDDVTADLVVLELAERGVPVFRFDTAEFPTRLVLAGELDGGRWTGGLRTSRRAVDFADVGAVYYRRPTAFRFPPMSADDRRWAHTEAILGFGGILGAIDATWVNHPHAMARAEYKPLQLVEAHRVGLRTPRTLITNDPDRARGFAASLPAGVVYKPLHGVPRVTPPVTLFTTPITSGQAGDPSVAGTAHLFQERIHKAFEARVTVVGNRVIAARIDAASDAARADWRSDADALTYTRIDPPDDVTAASVTLTHRLGLLYGALDFAITPAGDWVFFEANPAGQWAWIELLRQPITQALADLLQKGPT